MTFVSLRYSFAVLYLSMQVVNYLFSILFQSLWTTPFSEANIKYKQCSHNLQSDIEKLEKEAQSEVEAGKSESKDEVQQNSTTPSTSETLLVENPESLNENKEKGRVFLFDSDIFL